MIRISAIAFALWAVFPASAQTSNAWDGLLRVQAKHLDAVFLLPEADFRGYDKVLLEPTEVAFRKNWQRDANRQLNSQVSDAEARRILEGARDGLEKIFQKAYRDAGYELVSAPGPDVLRIGTAIVNLDVAAPDTMAAGITRTYTREAGSATLVVEARDSVSGALLGRAADADVTGDLGPYLRNRATNAAEFERLFDRWAKISAEGLAELKALSPIDAQGRLAKR